MLKNMKVGTKLIAVLLAPVLVLLILGYVGVSQRLSTASTTQRVEQLANMAAVNADVAHQLQREAIYSAAYMASAGTQWKDELATQRKATDVAVDQYNTTLHKVNPGKESADLAKDVSAVNSALSNLDTQRRSVDGLETPAPTAISQYDSASHRPGPAEHRHRRLGQRSRAGPRSDHLRQPQRGQGRRGQRGRPFGGARAGRPVPPDLAQQRPGRRALPGRQLELRHLQRSDRCLR